MSDILIKDMEMPKSCGECKLAVNAYGSLTEGKCAVLGYGVTYLRERHDACPLVEVPPHGRLIDADALLPKSGYDPMMFKHKYDGDHRTQYDTLMGYEILGIVEDAPTVLEAST